MEEFIAYSALLIGLLFAFSYHRFLRKIWNASAHSSCEPNHHRNNNSQSSIQNTYIYTVTNNKNTSSTKL